MVLGRLLLDSFVILYAFSLVMYFLETVQPRRVVNRTALSLLFLAFCLESAFLMRQLWSDGASSIYTNFDAILLVAWFILLIALVVNTFFRMAPVVFLANLLGFLVVLWASFSYRGTSVYTAPTGDLLALHITLAVASYAAFSFAFILSVIYLMQLRWLRSKTWTRWFFRLPSLEQLDVYSMRMVIVGVALLLIAISLGGVWAKVSGQDQLLTDPKVWATGAICVVYGLLLVLRARLGWGALRLVWFNIGCFLLLVINFLIISQFSMYHRVM